MVFFSYRTKRESPAGDQFWKFSCQCSIFGRIGNQWVAISSPGKGYVNGEWGSYTCARVTPITVRVVSKNESNFLLENKMVSTLIWRHVRLL